MTTADLARAEFVKPQSMGTTLADLEQAGLVQRRPHPTDGRQVLFALTAEGMEARRQRNIAKTAKNRRTSKKFKIGPAVKKRKGLGDDSGDDDFEVAKPSKKQTKITAFKAPRATVVEDLPKTNAFDTPMIRSRNSVHRTMLAT